MGNGMMLADCTLCDDSGVISDPATIDTPKIDRKSKSYHKAINEIMNLNPEISRFEAVKMFDKAYKNGG
jgi:hypothetical protein